MSREEGSSFWRESAPFLKNTHPAPSQQKQQTPQKNMYLMKWCLRYRRHLMLLLMIHFWQRFFIFTLCTAKQATFAFTHQHGSIPRSSHCTLTLAARRGRNEVAKTTNTKTTATVNKPAQLAGIVEDHRYEQFFYDEATTNELYQLVKLYHRPLLICNPSLAVLAERDGREYKLLDRDTRFDFLGGYEEFSLTEPHWIKDYNFDAVFIDPPFANVTPEQVAKCLRLISADWCPLWIAYNSRREEKLLDALNSLDCPDIVPKWRLSYKEGVSDRTQDSIWLYGPE
eukprot:scaffold5825_cov62-Cyclotella_meneghiniana.AAC.4